MGNQVIAKCEGCKCDFVAGKRKRTKRFCDACMKSCECCGAKIYNRRRNPLCRVCSHREYKLKPRFCRCGVLFQPDRTNCHRKFCSLECYRQIASENADRRARQVQREKELRREQRQLAREAESSDLWNATAQYQISMLSARACRRESLDKWSKLCDSVSSGARLRLRPTSRRRATCAVKTWEAACRIGYAKVNAMYSRYLRKESDKWYLKCETTASNWSRKARSPRAALGHSLTSRMSGAR